MRYRLAWVGVAVVAVSLGAFAQERGIGGTAPMGATSDSRVALVIGNAHYGHNPLRNPVNDATDMAAALRECGFDVIERHDADMRAMKEALEAFSNRIRRGGTALFYYAGHGIQVANRNYLVPLQANPTGPSTIEFECLDAGRVLGTLEDAGAYLNVIVLDACRNNPLSRAWTRDTRKGLASMEAPSGSIMAFATAAGSVAEDGPRRNGLYTGSLLKHMRTPGLDVMEVFRRTAADVQRQSGKDQVPWLSLSFAGQFSFHDAGSGGAPAVPKAAPLVTQPPPAPLALTGHLQVNVNAPDSAVRVDGASKGTADPSAPLNVTDLPAGRVRVEVSAPGFGRHECTVEILKGEWVQLAVELERTGSGSKAEAAEDGKNAAFGTGTISKAEAEAFVRNFIQTTNSGVVVDWIQLYADEVEYYDRGVVSRDFLVEDKLKYYERWPIVHTDLKGSVNVAPITGSNAVTVDYQIQYRVSSPARNESISGEAHNMMILRRVDGEIRIVSERQVVKSRDKGSS